MIERIRRANPLPEGAMPVAAGLVLTGIATFALFAITSRVLDEDEYSALAVLWTMLFAAGNGVMQPLEQEVARAVSDRRARGLGSAPLLRQASGAGLIFTAALGLVLGVLAPVISEELFGGNSALVPALVLGLLGFCAGHLVRGTLSSHGEFRAYGTFFAVDGMARPVLAGILAIAGVSAVGPYGWVVAVAPLIGAAAVMRGKGRLVEPGPAASWAELSANLGWLLVGTVSIALLLNGGAVAIELLATEDQKEAAGVFLNGLVIARVPLFLFQAVVAALLPKLSHQLGRGDHDGFTSAISRLLAAIAVVGVAATAVAAVAGPPVIDVMFGSEQVLASRDVALLAAASFVYMAAMSLGQALVALEGHGKMATGSLVGFATFVAVTAAGGDLFLRVELGLLLGSAISLAWMGAFVAYGARDRRRIHHLTLAEAVAEIPIEP